MTPNEISALLNNPSTVWEGVEALVDDLMNSVSLALQGAFGGDFPHTRNDIINTVYDYYGNHYDHEESASAS